VATSKGPILKVVTSESKLVEVTVEEVRSIFSLTRVNKEVLVTEERSEEVVVKNEEGVEDGITMVEADISSWAFSSGELFRSGLVLLSSSIRPDN